MPTRLAGALGLCLLFSIPATLWCQTAAGPIVRFHTNLGDIDVSLLSNVAPKTVANFLNYANRGAFDNSIVHRSVPGFIWQGGGYQWSNGAPVEITADPPVINEYNVSNTRGTLAMAKLGSDPNSATDQWFFNLGDNSRNLNNQNGGFTVFGRVINNAGLAVMDKIAAVPVPSPAVLPSPFDQMPLINYNGGPVQDSNVVTVLSVKLLVTPPTPVISQDGIVTAGNFGAFLEAAPGSYIEIYGSNLALADSNRSWSQDDFTNGNAPISLDGVVVTIDGLPAYVNFISPGQVNVQVPANVPTGYPVPVIVTNQGQSSAPVLIMIKDTAGGFYAPPGFKVNNKQYVAAFHAATGAYVSNGTIPNIPAAPARPGEILVLYGTGFGPVNPASVSIAGRFADGQTTLVTPVQFSIGHSPAQVVYAGLASGLIGVYQFNIVVPTDAANGDLPVQVMQGGEELAQLLFLSVQN